MILFRLSCEGSQDIKKNTMSYITNTWSFWSYCGLLLTLIVPLRSLDPWSTPKDCSGGLLLSQRCTNPGGWQESVSFGRTYHRTETRQNDQRQTFLHNIYSLFLLWPWLWVKHTMTMISRHACCTGIAIARKICVFYISNLKGMRYFCYDIDTNDTDPNNWDGQSSCRFRTYSTVDLKSI